MTYVENLIEVIEVLRDNMQYDTGIALTIIFWFILCIFFYLPEVIFSNTVFIDFFRGHSAEMAPKGKHQLLSTASLYCVLS